jgi:hypothetical protein
MRSGTAPRESAAFAARKTPLGRKAGAPVIFMSFKLVDTTHEQNDE